MIEELLKYQAVDGKLREIEVSLAQSEERKKAVAAQNVVKNANENIPKLDKKAEELAEKYNALVKALEKLSEAKTEYEGVVETLEDLDEVNYIKKKASALIDEIKALADNIESVSKEIKSVLDEFSRLAGERKKATEAYKEYAPKYNELKASKEGETNKIKEELVAMEKKISPDILVAYKKKRQEKIFPVVYSTKIMGKSVHCGRCGNELPIASAENLKKGELVECESCHRLLYSAQ